MKRRMHFEECSFSVASKGGSAQYQNVRGKSFTNFCFAFWKLYCVLEEHLDISMPYCGDALVLISSLTNKKVHNIT